MMEPFDDQYWMEHDNDNEFPWEFYNAVAKAGWLGITIPEEYGGGGLGVTEAAIVEHEISASGGGMNACSAVHIGIFGFDPIIRHGSEDLKQRFLPRVPTGDLHICLRRHRARRRHRHDRHHDLRPQGRRAATGSPARRSGSPRPSRPSGCCCWSARPSARTCAKKTDGMTLLFAEMDPEHVQIREIPKLGRNAVNTNELFIDDLFVADEDVVGEVGKGFRAILAGLNAERIIASNAALGIGRAAVRRATAYAKERHVFDRPIGQNQAVAHPIAEAMMRLDAAAAGGRQGRLAARQRLRRAARRPTMGKYLAADAAFKAADVALQTHGGYGFGKEFHVERYFREARLKRIAPISQEMVLNYLAEHVLGLPRSY